MPSDPPRQLTARAYIAWLARLTAGMRLRLLLRVAAGTARVAVMLLFVWLCKMLVDAAVDPSHTAPLWPYACALVACVAAQLALGAAVARITAATATAAANGLRLRMFDSAMRALYGRGLHSSDTLERMKKDVDTCADLMCVSAPAVAVTAFQLLAAFAFLAALSWPLALVMVAIMPLALIIGKIFVRRMRRLSARLRSLDSAIDGHIQEHVRLRHVDAAFGARGRAYTRLERLQARMLRLVLQRNDCSLFSRTLVQAGFAAGYLTAFLYGVMGLNSGAVTFGVMTAFLQLVSQVQRPALELAQYLPGFVYGMASAERVIAVTDAPAEREAGPPPAFDGVVGLRLDGVSFRYDDAPAPVIDGLSAHFAPGCMTAVTGMTGVGKTTLLRLIMAFVAPTAGAIRFYVSGGGEAPASPATRALLAYVPQGNTLLSGTVRDNLALARADASDADMRRALDMACCDFVYTLPAALDTRLGEGAATLSEGQAQRIAIARGLLRDAPLLLLDEPTSALDPDTERRLMANLASLTPQKTIIIITHRTPAAAACSATLRL